LNIYLRAGGIALSTSAAILLSLLWAGPIRHEKSTPPRLVLAPSELPADGYAIANLTIATASSEAPHVSVDNPHAAFLEPPVRTTGGWQTTLRAGVTPTRVTVRVEIPGAPAATASFITTAETGDSQEDGTPDFLRLDDPRDRAAFRHWFTYLAEVQYFQRAPSRPAEIADCAALIRYAYREALRSHAGTWAAEAHLPLVPAFESVARYQYPYTPLGASLFRVREGSYQPSDLADGAFAQFADAQTLQRLNTHFVSRDLARALPGDLLFYRQQSDRTSFHSMIFLGESQISKDGARYVVYHTGPDGADPGEIRRLSLPELWRFPEPQWRPLASNRNFLGVYRWNILASDGHGPERLKDAP
jgi:uncharacterized protein YfaT (DUF1175 family)